MINIHTLRDLPKHCKSEGIEVVSILEETSFVQLSPEPDQQLDKDFVRASYGCARGFCTISCFACYIGIQQQSSGVTMSNFRRP